MPLPSKNPGCMWCPELKKAMIVLLFAVKAW